MTYSYSESHTSTYAVYIAAKVVTDLKRMQRFYDEPSDKWIDKFEIEVIELLKHGYMGTVTYGFKRDGCWINPTLRYTARDLSGATVNDDDPGQIRPGASINNASFCSYLIYSHRWKQLIPTEQEKFAKQIPFQRSPAPEPGVDGHWTKDLTYSSDNCALDRASLRCS